MTSENIFPLKRIDGDETDAADSEDYGLNPKNRDKTLEIAEELLPETTTSSQAGGFSPSANDVPRAILPRPDVPDVNIYQHKKTVAQGMMDIALLSANANQLRYVLESGGNHPYYYASLSLIGISLILQVGVGVGLILNSRYDVSYEVSMRKANRINNYTVLGIFLITIMNVFVSAFGIASGNTNSNFPSSVSLREGSGELEGMSS